MKKIFVGLIISTSISAYANGSTCVVNNIDSSRSVQASDLLEEADKIVKLELEKRGYKVSLDSKDGLSVKYGFYAESYFQKEYAKSPNPSFFTALSETVKSYFQEDTYHSHFIIMSGSSSSINSTEANLDGLRGFEKLVQSSDIPNCID